MIDNIVKKHQIIIRGDRMGISRSIDLERPQGVKTQEIIGKKVLASDGSQIGVVDRVLMDPQMLDVRYIGVKKGLFSVDYYISRGYIDRLTEEGAILNIVPVEEFKGKKVFDKNGFEIGLVKDVNRISPGNEMMSIIVDQGIGQDDLLVDESEIGQLGESVILRKEKGMLRSAKTGKKSESS